MKNQKKAKKELRTKKIISHVKKFLYEKKMEVIPVRLISYNEIKKFIKCEEGFKGSGLFRINSIDEINKIKTTNQFGFNTEGNSKVGRLPINPHIKELMDSMERNDCELVNLTFALTTIFSKDGKTLELVVIDGNHRIECVKRLWEQSIKMGNEGFLANGREIAIIVRVVEVNTKEEYIKLVAEYNSTSKPYNNKNYIHDAVWAGLEPYIILDKAWKFAIKKSGRKSFQLELVGLVCCSGKYRTKSLRKHLIEISEPKWELTLTQMIVLQTILKKRRTTLSRAIYSVVTHKDYDHKKAVQILESRKPKDFSDDETQLRNFLHRVLGLYASKKHTNKKISRKSDVLLEQTTGKKQPVKNDYHKTNSKKIIDSEGIDALIKKNKTKH